MPSTCIALHHKSCLGFLPILSYRDISSAGLALTEAEAIGQNCLSLTP